MGSWQNLASWSEMVSIYKWPQKVRALPKFGGKNIKFWIILSRFPHSVLHISETKRRIEKQCQSTTCPPKVDLLSVTFDPETAKICLLIVTDPSAAIKLQPP